MTDKCSSIKCEFSTTIISVGTSTFDAHCILLDVNCVDLQDILILNFSTVFTVRHYASAVYAVIV